MQPNPPISNHPLQPHTPPTHPPPHPPPHPPTPPPTHPPTLHLRRESSGEVPELRELRPNLQLRAVHQHADYGLRGARILDDLLAGPGRVDGKGRALSNLCWQVEQAHAGRPGMTCRQGQWRVCRAQQLHDRCVKAEAGNDVSQPATPLYSGCAFWVVASQRPM